MSSRRHEIGVGLLLIVAMLVTGFMALKVGAIRSFTPRIMVNATIADATGVSVGSSVSIAGVEVGEVDSLRIDYDRAVLVLALEADAGVRSDTQVRVRSRSVLGEKYIELTPQSPDSPFIEEGGELSEAAERTEIDQLVNTLGGLLSGVDPEIMGDVTDSIRSTLAEDPERLSRMLKNADRTLENLANATDELDGLITTGKATLTDANRAVGVLRARATEAKPVLQKADQVLSDLQNATSEVPDAVREARETLAAAKEAVGLVNASADDLETVLENLSEIDRYELRRILREDGILVRFRPKQITQE